MPFCKVVVLLMTEDLVCLSKDRRARSLKNPQQRECMSCHLLAHGQVKESGSWALPWNDQEAAQETLALFHSLDKTQLMPVFLDCPIFFLCASRVECLATTIHAAILKSSDNLPGYRQAHPTMCNISRSPLCTFPAVDSFTHHIPYRPKHWWVMARGLAAIQTINRRRNY